MKLIFTKSFLTKLFFCLFFIFSFNSKLSAGETGPGPGAKYPKRYKTGKVYVLSIGINKYINYPPGGEMQYCTSDAIEFVDIINNEFIKHGGSDSLISSYLLIDSLATKENILKALNDIISKAKPEDFFFFNFAGVSSELIDSSGLNDVYFYPYLKYDLNEGKSPDFFTTKDKISLTEFRNLADFIIAKQQLMLSEAGFTPNFQKLFIKSMIESSPTISDLTHRNRVLLLPRKVGYEGIKCDNKFNTYGPIMYYLNRLSVSNQVNLFDLFSDSADLRKNYEYQLFKIEHQCNAFKEPYLTVFFENDFINDIKEILGSKTPKSRGGNLILDESEKVLETVGRKFAIVVGINNYSLGSPTWKSLDNPIPDALKMADILKNNYGFEVKLMLDASADSLLAALKMYSKIMHENDQFIFFIAGHGDYDPYFFDDGFLVMANSLSYQKDPNRRTYLPFSLLKNIIDNLPPNQILLLVDVCFGGAFDTKISQGSKRSSNSMYEDVSLDRMLKEKLKLKTRIVLSSGSLNEVPDGFMGKNSPFTSKIAHCLLTGGGDKKVLTTAQLFEFVQWLPSKPLKGELMGNEAGSEFFLIAR